MHSKRFLILTTLMEPGGAQKAMLELARGLLEHGHHVVVAVMYDKGDFIPLFERRYGIEIIDLGMKQPGHAASPLAKIGRFIRGLVRLFGLMRRGRIEVLQTFTHYSNIIGPIVAWAARVPVRVTSQRTMLVNRPRWLLALDRIVANSWLTTCMVSVSEQTRRFSIEQERIRADKILTIPNGIDLDALEAQREDDTTRVRADLDLLPEHRVVSVVARLHPQKGHGYLLEAVPLVLEREPNAVFLLMGDGELRDELESSIRAAGLKDAVRLLGARPDVQRILGASDLFVLPSLWEGMPNAVLEAMAAGLAVVATPVGGTPEVVVHGETGLLVPVQDGEALAGGITELLLDDAKRKAFGEAARERAHVEFPMRAYVERHLALYRRLVRSES